MSATDELRKAFDDCTIMAGVEPDFFECVYIVKDAALLYLDEIDAENAKLRKLLDDAYLNLRNRDSTIEVMGLPMTDGQREVVARIEDGMRELGMEVIR